jgi:hypothetical protein
MPQQFSNNARSTLTSTINAAATALTIQAEAADLFPVANVGTGSIPSTNNWFKTTLQDVSGNVEIIYVRTRTAGSAVFSNILRGQEGTTAREFVAGAIVGLRLTAADVQASINIPSADNTFSGDNEFLGTADFLDAVEFSDSVSFTAEITSSGATTFTQASTVDFAGATTGVTQPFGTNNTTLSTTAFVQAALQTLHPVGSIYINATNATNPGTLLGFGTWTAFGAGRVPVGFNAADPLFDTAEETGGSKDAIVVSHTHAITSTTASAGSHAHNIGGGSIGGSAGGGILAGSGGSAVSASAGDHTHAVTSTAANTGVSGANANLQPYITVYMWKRTA